MRALIVVQEMRIPSRAVILAGIFALSGCGNPDKLWEDGNYRVYKRPNSREIIMGYHFGDGGVLGLSEPTVTAAGANARHVVFQVNTSSNYYIVREAAGEGTTLGPFDDKEFENIRRQHSLPPFDWHLRQ